MDTATYLHNVGCSFVEYNAREMRIVDIVNPEPGERPIPVSATFSTTGEASSWLERDAVTSSRSDHKQTASRLRLLVCEWDPLAEVRMPFDSQESMETVLKLLETPRYYLHDIGRGYHVPLRLMIEGTGTKKRLSRSFPSHSKTQLIAQDVICQTPQFRKSFATTALSYNPATGTTTGFLGHIADQSSDLMENLIAMSTCSTHPLLLPALMYSAYCSKLRYQLLQVRDQIDTVQEETGQVLKMSASGKEPTAQSESASQNTYESLHKTLVEQHARLTNGLSDFIAELGPACEKALSTIEVDDVDIKAIKDTAAHADVKLFVSILLTAARFDLQNRERLLGRVSIQLQVLYNLMQQKISNQAMHESALMKDIANLTLRDSSAMKSIALLTMIFLPSTAVASIFSISSFFQASADGSGLLVSDKFWIFWTVSLPITFVVVMIWVTWTQRREIMNYAAGWRKRRHEKAASKQQPDSEKGPSGTTNFKRH